MNAPAPVLPERLRLMRENGRLREVIKRDQWLFDYWSTHVGPFAGAVGARFRKRAEELKKELEPR